MTRSFRPAEGPYKTNATVTILWADGRGYTNLPGFDPEVGERYCRGMSQRSDVTHAYVAGSGHFWHNGIRKESADPRIQQRLKASCLARRDARGGSSRPQ